VRETAGATAVLPVMCAPSLFCHAWCVDEGLRNTPEWGRRAMYSSSSCWDGLPPLADRCMLPVTAVAARRLSRCCGRVGLY
jgi:hypothetical protein